MGRKIDRHKLEAMVADKGASPAERAIAGRHLAELLAERRAIIVDASESWQMALVMTLSDKYGLATASAVGGFVEVEGPVDLVLEFQRSLDLLRPELESTVISATAGFLAAHFEQAVVSEEVEDRVQATARQAATPPELRRGPKEISASVSKRFPGVVLPEGLRLKQ